MSWTSPSIQQVKLPVYFSMYVVALDQWGMTSFTTWIFYIKYNKKSSGFCVIYYIYVNWFSEKTQVWFTSDLGKNYKKIKTNLWLYIKYTIFMKKLLGVDTWYLNSQKKLKNLMNHYKNNKVLADLVSGNNKIIQDFLPPQQSTLQQTSTDLQYH